MMVVQLCEYMKCTKIVPFKMVKMVNFVLRVLYHNKKNVSINIWVRFVDHLQISTVLSSISVSKMISYSHFGSKIQQ